MNYIKIEHNTVVHNHNGSYVWFPDIRVAMIRFNTIDETDFIKNPAPIQVMYNSNIILSEVKTDQKGLYSYLKLRWINPNYRDFVETRKQLTALVPGLTWHPVSRGKIGLDTQDYDMGFFFIPDDDMYNRFWEIE